MTPEPAPASADAAGAQAPVQAARPALPGAKPGGPPAPGSPAANRRGDAERAAAFATGVPAASPQPPAAGTGHPGRAGSVQVPPSKLPPGSQAKPPAVPRQGAARADERARQLGLPQAPPPLNFPKPVFSRPQLSNWAQVATAADRETEADRRADRYEVEVHKKWSISFACISFVIIGIVMALRFPRGGIGLVIGGGLLVFSVHYVGLTAGESLADRGLVSPWLAMWAPNIVLTVLGIIGLFRVSRESGSTRGGDFQEILDGIRHLLPPAPRGAGASSAEARMSLTRTLDRYVFGSWVRIFVLTALGFPLVSILINLTDTLNKLLDRGLSMREIVVSYIYSIPENAFIVMPAAVLFATVFTVGAMGRHSELTAAKAGGLSFYRLMLPVFVAAALATGAGVRRRRDGPRGHGARARAAEGQAAALHQLEVQLRLPRRRGLGLHHPLARRGHAAAQAAHARAPGQRASAIPASSSPRTARATTPPGPGGSGTGRAG